MLFLWTLISIVVGLDPAIGAPFIYSMDEDYGAMEQDVFLIDIVQLSPLVQFETEDAMSLDKDGFAVFDPRDYKNSLVNLREVLKCNSFALYDLQSIMDSFNKKKVALAIEEVINNLKHVKQSLQITSIPKTPSKSTQNSPVPVNIPSVTPSENNPSSTPPGNNPRITPLDVEVTLPAPIGNDDYISKLPSLLVFEYNFPDYHDNEIE